MKNKIFKLTALWMVVVGFAACQSNEDVLPIAEDLANKTLLGYYTYTTLDSVAMQTASEEFYLMRNAKDEQKGYYRTSVMGDDASKDENFPITWVSQMADDQMSMLIEATLPDGAVKNFIWQDGVVKEGDHWFSKNVAGMSNITVLNTIYDNQLTNVVFETSQTTYHNHTVNQPYLQWSSAVEQGVTDTLKAKQKYLDILLPQADTIIWFMKNKRVVEQGYVGNAHPVDTVIDGKDTTIIENLVYVTGNGPYNVYYLTSDENKNPSQVNDRPEVVFYSSMTFNRVNNLNTATYVWHKSEYTLEHYTKPGKASDKGTDSLYTFTATKWVVPEFTNLAKFDVMLYGIGDSTITKSRAGVESIVKQETYEDTYKTLNLSGYGVKMNPTDSTTYVRVVLNDLEYRLKQ